MSSARSASGCDANRFATSYQAGRTADRSLRERTTLSYFAPPFAGRVFHTRSYSATCGGVWAGSYG